ncbi:hypothetical protein M407DRAFT_30955 [Tulasnella calospora MUT 4182]|uniref:Protein kinase domain-containing protein n=1 Tax=Tulasnella calospora MUT 4182 TaxID=1051891 RepID=A0A0C3Q6J0_9AGAM|nr:hypothetical protein M407DRAFT_30955 [Tulasnella calospora MUT 4182]
MDTGKSKRIKLSARGLEILEALSGKRISITDIEFSETTSKDGGTFADVAAATLIITSSNTQRGRRIAVKKLRLINEETFFSGFVNELRLLEQLSHPNIVEIIGFVEDMDNHIAWLVFPWEDNGNLRQFLRSGTWELPERVSLIYDVAVGLEYLHARQPPICHGDLKSLNILVNSSNHAVITDFGSARIVERETASAPHQAGSAGHTASKRNESAEFKIAVSNTTLTLTGPACSVRWAPPEYFNGNSLDLPSDIWALGWISWEAITDSYPFEELDSEVHVPMQVIEGQLPMIYDHHQLSQIHQLCCIMQKCWKPNPRERLSATECRRTIRWVPRAIPSVKSGNQSTTRSARLLMQIGNMHRLQSRREEASRMFEQGLAVAQYTGDQGTLVDLLILMADTHRIGTKLGGAEASFIEALAISTSIGDRRRRANVLRGLGDVRREQSRYTEAETSYVEALAIYKSIGNVLGQAHALRCLGDALQEQSKYVGAAASYAGALAIYMSIGDTLGRANVLNGLGHVWRQQSYYTGAEASFAGALAIYTIIGNGLGRAGALIGLGEVRRLQSKYTKAEASFAEALAIYKIIGNGLGRASALAGLGDVRRLQSKYTEAEASFDEALVIYNNIRNDLGRANVLGGLGDVQRQQSKYIEAEVFYAQALAIYKSIGNDFGQVNSSLRLAEIRLRQAQYAEAKALVGDATSRSGLLNYAWGMDTSDELLVNILEAERSAINPLTSAPPPPIHAEDSTPPASLPITDKSYAVLP